MPHIEVGCGFPDAAHEGINHNQTIDNTDISSSYCFIAAQHDIPYCSMRLDIPSFSSEQDSLSDITKLDIPFNANGYREKSAIDAVTYGYKGESDESDGNLRNYYK